jgi:tetratricopeptide (TPR) repeat protein
MNWSSTMAMPESIAPQKRSWLLGVLLLLSFLLYANAVVNEFVYDDHSQIERNPYVHSFKYIGKIFGSSLLAQQGKQAAPNFYRPIVNFSFLLCYELFGLSPYGFHLISLLLNCIAVWLVFVVSAELFSSEWLALITAAFFALHPIHSEPVAWIDGVSDLYVSVFYLLAFWLFLRQSREQSQLTSWARVGMAASFALALFSKETAMTFPVLATVYEHLYHPDRFITRWTQKLSRYGWSWLTLFVYLVVRTISVGRLVPARLHTDFSSREVLFSALALIGQYAQKLVWPSPLLAFYPFQKSVSFADAHVLLGLAVVAGVVAAFVLLWKRARLYTFALFWIGLTIAPALNARWMTATVFAERYLYLPSVGFSWLVSGILFWCWRRTGAWTHGLRWALAAASVIVAFLASREIIVRNRDWKSDQALIVRTLEVRPDSPNMRNDLGMMKWFEGDHAEAERQWQLALAHKPDTVEVLSNLGFARLEEKKYDEAIVFLQRAIQLKPLFAAPHVHLARVYAAQGKNAVAEAEFLRAIEIHPTDSAARKALGQFYLHAGRLSEAEQQFLVSVSVAPDLEAWSALGVTYDRQNSTAKAEDAWRHVLSFESLNAQAHLSLGRIYLSKRQLTEAHKEFEACLLMDPANPQALAGIQNIRDAVNSLSPSPTQK